MTLSGYRPDRFFDGLRAVLKASGLPHATVEYSSQHAEYVFRCGAHVRRLGYYILMDAYDRHTAVGMVANIAQDIKQTIAQYQDI